MPGFCEFWGNLIPADVFAFQASGILGKFEPGGTLATSDAKSIGRDCKCHYDALVFLS